MSSGQTRTYQRAESVVFLKTNEAFGGLSNMAGGFPLRVNGVRILTSEALYQACRFPRLPDVQRLIIEQRSPMTAKMKSKPHRKNSRADWDQVRVKIMRWCLRVKLAQNWRKFSEILLETDDRPIVEQSCKDDFWGAKPVDDDTLVGMNVLGRLLMELRETVKAESRESLSCVQPLAIPDFLLGGEPIEVVAALVAEIEIVRVKTLAGVQTPRGDVDGPAVVQQSLFDEPVATGAPLQTNPGVKDSGVRIADMEPYSEYKESGLPWLGQVPGHWEIRPAFGAFVPNRELNEGLKEKTVLSLSYGRIVIKPLEKLHGLVPESFETYQIVNPGDIVLRTTDLQNDHTSLRVGMVRDRGIITSAYLALHVNAGVSPEFGFQFLNVWDTSKALYGYGSGLRQNLDFSHFKRMPVPVPPPDEQAAIVRFLDWANGRLERVIRAKRKTIALLNEQKQAIIHHAVTRGLDPSVPLKPSGIPWLGDIPEHWEVRRLGYAIRLKTGFPFASDGFVQGESGTRLLRGINVTPSGIRWDEVVRWQRKPSDGFDEFALEVGDIVLGMDRPIIGSGVRAAAIRESDTPSLLLQRVARIRPTGALDAKFLLHLIRGRLFNDYITPIFTGVSVPHLSPQQIKHFRVPLPPLEEQQKILEHLESETISLETAISRLEREIDLIREYRTRLVADVVTGKLDVREAAARLPDEAPLQPVEDDLVLAEEFETADEVVAL